MIDFYYIISQKPFYKSQPDSFIGRKRRFCFYSRDPSLKITELSQFDSGPVAMGRHFSKRISVLSPPPVEVLWWHKLFNCHSDWCHTGLRQRRKQKRTRCLSAKERAQAHYTCRWASRWEGAAMDSRGSVGSEQSGHPQLFFQDTCMILDAPSTRLLLEVFGTPWGHWPFWQINFQYV